MSDPSITLVINSGGSPDTLFSGFTSVNSDLTTLQTWKANKNSLISEINLSSDSALIALNRIAPIPITALTTLPATATALSALTSLFNAYHNPTTGAPVIPTEWQPDAGQPTYINSTTLTVPGNRSDIQLKERIRVHYTDSTTQIVGLLNVVFNSAPNSTTLSLNAALVETTPLSIDRGLVHASIPLIAPTDMTVLPALAADLVSHIGQTTGVHGTTVGASIVDTLANQTINGVKTFSAFPLLTASSAPTQATQAVPKSYVDSSVSTVTATLTGQRNIWNGAQPVPPISLGFAPAIVTNAVLSDNFRVNMTGNTLLQNPTGLVDGQTLTWHFTQDSSGGRKLSFDSMFKFQSGAVPALTQAPKSADILVGQYDANLGIIKANLLQDFR